MINLFLRAISNSYFVIPVITLLIFSCGSKIKVGTPTFDIASGTYTNDITITISVAPVDAKIYYTIDGTDPSTASTEYTEAISITGDGANITIKAIGVMIARQNSDIAEASYFINYSKVQLDPTFDRPSTYFVDPITVTITAPTDGAVIEYTTDGSDPVCDGDAYDSPKAVAITDTTTLKAISCKNLYDDSDITDATYTKVVPDHTVDCTVAGTPIQDKIDDAGTLDGHIIYLQAGECDEDGGQITINKRIWLIGAGNGDNPSSDTILNSAAAGNLDTVNIAQGGTSESARTAVRNLRVTESTDGTGNVGIGIMINTLDGHIEIDYVAVTNNAGYGIGFDGSSGDTEDIVIKNSTVSGNGSTGFRTTQGVIGNIDGLVIDNCVFEDNAGAGIELYNLNNSTPGTTDVTIRNTSLKGNAIGVATSSDIVVTDFFGDLEISNVTVESNGADTGIRISGDDDGVASPNRRGKAAAGIITLTDVTVSGTQQANGSYPSAGIVITRYLGLDNVTFSNVVIDSTAPHGLFFGTITDGSSFDIGNLSFAGTFSEDDITLGKHGDSSTYVATDIDINATGATFTGAASDEDIENRVWHSVDDASLGTVSWTTP